MNFKTVKESLRSNRRTRLRNRFGHMTEVVTFFLVLVVSLRKLRIHHSI